MTIPARSNSVPKLMLPVYEKIAGLTDDVCYRHLNPEYRTLARAMTGALCRKRPPHWLLVNRGRGHAASSTCSGESIFLATHPFLRT